MARAVVAPERSFRLFLLLVVLGVGVLIFGRQSSGPAKDALAPDFTLPVVAGGTGRFHLADARGTPVMVEVFASWCGVCRHSAPAVAAAALAPRQREVRFVGVSVDQSADEAVGAAKAWNIPYAVAFDDGKLAKAWNVTVLPTFVLIDAEGRVRHVSAGSPSDKELETWLGEVGAARL
jgi:peroxiredoxin